MSHYLVECSIGVHCVQLYAALLTPLLWFRSNANAAQLGSADLLWHDNWHTLRRVESSSFLIATTISLSTTYRCNVRTYQFAGQLGRVSQLDWVVYLPLLFTPSVEPKRAEHGGASTWASSSAWDRAWKWWKGQLRRHPWKLPLEGGTLPGRGLDPCHEDHR